MTQVRVRGGLTKGDLFLLLGLVCYWPFLTIGTFVHGWAGAANFGAGMQWPLVHSLATDYSLLLVAVFAILFAARRRVAALAEKTVPTPRTDAATEKVVPTSRCALVAKKTVILAWVAAALGSAGCALLVAAGSMAGGARVACVAGIVLVAIFVGVFTLLWGERTSGGDIVRLLLAVLVSAAVSRVLVAVYYLVGVNQSLLFVARPLLGALFLTLAGEPEASGVRTLEARALGQVPWGVVVPTVLLLAVASIVAQVVSGYGLGDAGTVSHLLNVLVVLVACVGMGVGATRLRAADDLLVLFACVFVAGAGLLLVALLVPGFMDLTIGLRICLATFLWVVFAYTCSVRRVSAYVLFCAYGVLCVAVLGARLFDHAGLIRVLAEEQIGLAVAALLAFAASSGAVLAFVARSRRRARQETQRSQDWQRDLCERACANAGLTARELEVVTFAYRGFSAKGTGEQLVVSEYTVKNHLANAYRKLGVHSKQELIEFIDAQR